MKRDLDLVRKIIVHLQDRDSESDLDPVEIEGYSSKIISYHLGQMYNAGLIDAIRYEGEDHSIWLAKDLTWAGHDLADLFKSESLWSQAKKAINDAVGTVTLEALRFILNEALNGRLQNYFKL